MAPKRKIPDSLKPYLFAKGGGRAGDKKPAAKKPAAKPKTAVKKPPPKKKTAVKKPVAKKPAKRK